MNIVSYSLNGRQWLRTWLDLRSAQEVFICLIFIILLQNKSRFIAFCLPSQIAMPSSGVMTFAPKKMLTVKLFATNLISVVFFSCLIKPQIGNLIEIKFRFITKRHNIFGSYCT